DNVVDTEAEALEQVRRFLAYLPASVWEAPPRCKPADDPKRKDEWLLGAVPRNRRQAYDMRRILAAVFDEGSVFELARGFGPSLMTALARLDGFAVGVLAADPRVYGGGLTAAASDKLARFVDFADTFHLPLVHLVDQPGFVVGVDAEKAGTIRRGVRALAAVYQAQVPFVSVIVR